MRRTCLAIARRRRPASGRGCAYCAPAQSRAWRRLCRHAVRTPVKPSDRLIATLPESGADIALEDFPDRAVRQLRPDFDGLRSLDASQLLLAKRNDLVGRHVRILA